MNDYDKEYAISEISEICGYPAHVLRYYEKEFELDIPRNAANHRYYTYKEIETFNYIKTLQEKGFTNKQIKLIMNSPEVLLSGENEAAVTSLSKNEAGMVSTYDDIFNFIRELFIDELQPKLIDRENSSLTAINELKNEIIELRNEVNSKERDVLVCENAKLKMKVKEKAYEVADLKEKLKREQESNKSIFKKILGIKKA
ncbi:MerR family transcriptional regulator [Brassicibacter mesophilus]|uniref:MerR family transcriptional regulator n=1 Tax=Brassicibacter mesophilus TaxID=745119 RepID=UPI003D219534